MCILTVAVLVVPIGIFGGQGSNQSSGKHWTLLMYWDADNNLEFCTEFAMSTWEESLPSNADINIVAMVDILSEDGTWIWEIVDGKRKLVDT